MIEIYFNTIDSSGAPVAPSSAFTTADFAIYKDGSATEKTTANGLTVTSPFDSQVGLHLLQIDPSVQTGDNGFWQPEKSYTVRYETAKTVSGQSIDGQKVPDGNFTLPNVDIGYRKIQIDNPPADHIYWDAGYGVCKDEYGLIPARWGDQALSWWDRSGQYLAKFQGTNAVNVFRESKLRPGQPVIYKTKGCFFFEFDGGTLPIYTATQHWGWSYSGSVDVDQVNTSIPFLGLQRNATPLTGTHSMFLGQRSNFANYGFSGSDSAVRMFRGDAGVVSGLPSTYPSGGPGAWQTVLYRRADDGASVHEFYFPYYLEGVESVGGGGWSSAHDQVVIGARLYDPDDDTVTDDDIAQEIGHVGLWVLTTAAAAKSLGETLNDHQPNVYVALYGDSRVESLIYHGTFIVSNSHGYHFKRLGNTGDGVSEMATLMAGHYGRQWDVAIVWIGRNEFSASTDSDTPFAELVAATQKGQEQLTWKHLVLLNDCPDNVLTPTANQQALKDFSELIELQYSGTAGDIVVDSWRATQDPTDELARMAIYTNDGTHMASPTLATQGVDSTLLISNSTAGYELIVRKMLLPILDQTLGYDPGSDALVRNAQSLEARVKVDTGTITGSDGVTLATAQANYAPNTVVPDAAGTAPTAAEIDTELSGTHGAGSWTGSGGSTSYGGTVQATVVSANQSITATIQDM